MRRRLFDLSDASIGGEIVRRGDTLRMTIRTRDRHGTDVVEVSRKDDDVELLLRDAGRAIFRATDPYILATYLYSQEANAGSETYPETLAAIAFVLSHPPESDDAWALMLRGNVRRDQGRFDEAIADYRAALARDPIRARGNLAQALMDAGRRDEALAYTRQMLARADYVTGQSGRFRLGSAARWRHCRDQGNRATAPCGPTRGGHRLPRARAACGVVEFRPQASGSAGRDREVRADSR